MNKTVKTISLTAALAVMIPLSAYAADAVTGSSSSAPSSAAATSTPQAAAPAGKAHRGGFGADARALSQEVLDLLKLDQEAVRAKLAEGKTLAEIATEQGVSRDALKQVLTDASNKRLEERKQAFADNLDSLIDRPGGNPAKDRKIGMKGVFGARDLASSASVLGMSEDELKTGLESGKSLADLAKEKNVDVQKLIDAQTEAIKAAIQEAVASGKLTQEQADKQLADAAEVAERIVNDTHVRKGPGGRGGHGGVGGHGGHRAGAEAGAGGTSGTSDQAGS